MASPVNEMRITDAKLSGGAALSNAANTVNGNAIDLAQVTPFPTTGRMRLRIVTTAATGANDKNVNIRLQHSHEAAANFINIPEVANPLHQVTSANDVVAASNSVYSMPSTVRRYIRAVALGETNGGNSSDGAFTLSVLF